MKEAEHYESLDKRSKEYKDWKKSQKAEGLGDVVEKVLEKTGIAKAAKFILGDDCKCEERKEALNKIWRRSPECLQEDEYNYLKDWFAQKRDRMKPSEQRKMLVVYNRIFKTKQQFTTCASCLRDINGKMLKVFEAYED